MAAAEVGALRVVLGMDVAQFSEGAKNADQVLNRLATRMGITAGVAAAAGTLIGNALTAAAASIVDGIKGAINSAEEMADAAEKFGLSIETVSAIVKSGEVPIASLNAALEKLSQNLVLVGSGEATSPAARALRAAAQGVNGKQRHPSASSAWRLITRSEGARGAGRRGHHQIANQSLATTKNVLFHGVTLEMGSK